MKIKSLIAIEILDSRGKPTVRTFVTLDDDSTHCASVPSGASTGSHEAVELRDDNPQRFLGFGVSKAVENVNNIIAPKLIGLELDQLEKLDETHVELDGTENKSSSVPTRFCQFRWRFSEQLHILKKKTYGNFYMILFFSEVQACTSHRLMVNVVNGGKHASGTLTLQEFMISPKTINLRKQSGLLRRFFFNWEKNLKKNTGHTWWATREGFLLSLGQDEEVLETNNRGSQNNRPPIRHDFDLALDSAAQSFSAL
jgi:enolase